VPESPEKRYSIHNSINLNAGPGHYCLGRPCAGRAVRVGLNKESDREGTRIWYSRKAD
jgi:hypothetical protein